MRLLTGILVASVGLCLGLTPSASAVDRAPTKSECVIAVYETLYNSAWTRSPYASIAGRYPATLTKVQRDRMISQCKRLRLAPTRSEQARLAKRAAQAVLQSVQKERQLCATAWYDRQYADVAPGFPVTMTGPNRESIHASCTRLHLLPSREEQTRLTQTAFNTVAQILEREIRRVSAETRTPPCEALYSVLKPVGAGGQPLSPSASGDVWGYAGDSFLPILRYNWYSGPFRLKFGVGCGVSSSLWLFSDPYPPEFGRAERFPSDVETKQNPWNRTPVGGPMSTCITWGPGLGNDGIGGKAKIFGFSWSRVNLPEDVRSCYPRIMGENGLGQYSVEPVANLP